MSRELQHVVQHLQVGVSRQGPFGPRVPDRTVPGRVVANIETSGRIPIPWVMAERKDIWERCPKLRVEDWRGTTAFGSTPQSNPGIQRVVLLGAGVGARLELEGLEGRPKLLEVYMIPWARGLPKGDLPWMGGHPFVKG